MLGSFSWTIFGLGIYGGLTWFSLHQASLPNASCEPTSRCFRPWITPDELLEMKLYVLANSSWLPVETCHYNITIRSSSSSLLDDKNCSIPLPRSWRERLPTTGSKPHHQAKFRFQFSNGTPVLDVPVHLISMKLQKSRSGISNKRSLLELSASDGKEREERMSALDDRDISIPHLRYGLAPIRIRFVTEYRSYGDLLRQDGVRLQPVQRSFYRPLIYVDDNSLQSSAQVEISEDVEKPPIPLHIKVTAVSPTLDALNRMISDGLTMTESFLAGSELDELRYFLQDEKLYRFACSQTISFVHIWLDYLAFQDEVRFYRGRTNLTGVSASSAISHLICSIIIFLYLLDGNGTSWVVLSSLAVSCMVEAWKVGKILQPKWSRTWPFVSFRSLRTGEEQNAADYDRIAAAKLGMVLYPVIGVIGVWSLYHYTYKSWWSWFIGNLANAVYTFGFISMCPQLYVNYRLKSVAHLPWKVFMYKIFTTFVDDVFAFLVEMPLKHRLMTLRDDVVFMVLLYQAYIYRVDKTRANEYGYVYEEEDTKGAPKQTALLKEKVE